MSTRFTLKLVPNRCQTFFSRRGTRIHTHRHVYTHIPQLIGQFLTPQAAGTRDEEKKEEKINNKPSSLLSRAK